MKSIILYLTLISALMTTTGAAPLREQDYSARPIDNVTLNRADRAFLINAAEQIILQRKAAEMITGPTATLPTEPLQQTAPPSTNIVDDLSPRAVAQDLARTLSRVEQDLNEVAKAKGVALPLEGSLEPDAEFEKLLDTGAGQLDREYAAYAERNIQRLLDQFYTVSKKARDPQVRAFALRHLRAIYQQFKVARVIERNPSAPPQAVASTTRAPANEIGASGSASSTVSGSAALPPGRAGEIFAPHRPDPTARAR